MYENTPTPKSLLWVFVWNSGTSSHTGYLKPLKITSNTHCMVKAVWIVLILLVWKSHGTVGVYPVLVPGNPGCRRFNTMYLVLVELPFTVRAVWRGSCCRKRWEEITIIQKRRRHFPTHGISSTDYDPNSSWCKGREPFTCSPELKCAEFLRHLWSCMLL